MHAVLEKQISKYSMGCKTSKINFSRFHHSFSKLNFGVLVLGRLLYF